MRDPSRGARIPAAIAFMLVPWLAAGQVAPILPYSAIGFLEADGARMAVLARGDLILLKKQGDDVGSEFRMAVVDPPALLHLPTGVLLQVPRATPGVDAQHTSDPITASVRQSAAPIDATSTAEFQAALARALAAP